jgi:hypothetical protein
MHGKLRKPMGILSTTGPANRSLWLTHESTEVLLVATAGLDYEDFWFVPEAGAVLIVEFPAKDQSYQKNHLEMKNSRSGGLLYFVYFL